MPALGADLYDFRNKDTEKKIKKRPKQPKKADNVQRVNLEFNFILNN